MKLFFGPIQPADLVGQWLKPSGAADTVHRIIWRGGDELRTGCQAKLDARRAVRPALGARLCATCWQDALAKDQYHRTHR
jgi:hypothetical protein